MKDLADKTVIITGADGLIGKEIARQFADHGSKTVCADIAFQTSVIDDRTASFHLDLTDTKSIDALIGFTLEKFGRIDGLVNAAYPHTKDWGRYKFEDTPFEHWEENVRMQLNPVFYIDREAAKVMERQKSGSIVNFGSIYGIVGNDFTIYEAYNLSLIHI